MIKRLRYIFIPVLTVLLMSHNVGAVELVLDLSNYEHFRVASYPKISCSFGGSDVVTTNYANTCQIVPTQSLTTDTWMYDMRTEQSWQFLKNDLVNFKLYVSSNGLDGLSRVKPYLNYMGKDDSTFHVIAFNVMYDQVPVEDLDALMAQSGGSSYHITYSDLAKFVTVYDITLSVAQDYTGPVYLSGNNNRYYNLFTIPTAYPVITGNNFVFSTGNYFIYRPTEQAVNKEQEQKTQDAANNSSAAGGGSSSDATSATSSLLSVIGSGIGAITTASPTNCKINGNMGNLNIGNIDLCANPVPSFIAVIGSIIAVLVVLPLVIVLFNRFISIIRSFQG